MAISRISRRRHPRGNATVEFALIAPLMVALLLWSNYFYEALYAKIKTAEMARYIGFERTVRKDLAGILAEAKSRYQDLDGTTKGQALPGGYRNLLTVDATASLTDAPFGGDMGKAAQEAGNGVSGLLQKVASAFGSTVGKVANSLGFQTTQGAVRADVTFSLQNRVVPTTIAGWVISPGKSLNLSLKDSFFMYHDTWRAWEPGDQPGQASYDTVQSRTQQRVRKVAYLGLAQLAPGVMSSIGKVLNVLGLEFPLDNGYIDSAVLIRKPTEPGRYSDIYGTRTMPGDRLMAPVWYSDQYRTPPWWVGTLKEKTGHHSGGGYNDNWPMRAYNCRGDFFQGQIQSKLPEVYVAKTKDVGSYFTVGSNACVP
jgi:hypothetical protein